MQLERQSNGDLITFGSSAVLGGGGEARIYAVAQAPGLVAKVYYQPTEQHARKLAVMITNPPVDPMAAHGHSSIAWPVDLLRTADGRDRVVGFLMPRVTGMLPIIDFYNPKSRRQKCPLFNYRYLHRTARNLAAGVAGLHARGYVIGDVNESNILVNPKALLTLVDTDSFQVRDLQRQRVYRCPVGKPEFTPPELQGKTFAHLDRAPEHDLFGLAVLIFELLMEGTHPFAGVFRGRDDPPPYEERILRGHFPHGSNSVPYSPMPFAPDFQILHPALHHLFVVCFEQGHKNPQARPGAGRWQEALIEAENALVGCSANPQHFYGKHLNACPWCARAARLGGLDPFPATPTAAPPRRPRPPARPTRYPTMPPPTPVPSPAPVARRKVWRWAAVLLILAMVGFWIIGFSLRSSTPQPPVPQAAAKKPSPAPANVAQPPPAVPPKPTTPRPVPQGAAAGKPLAPVNAPLFPPPPIPPGWTADTRRVTVVTPNGNEEKEIIYCTNSIGMKLVLIPAGEFMMGGPDGEEARSNDEGPQHKVRIAKPFYLGAYEVTQAQYEAIMGQNPANFKGENNPVESVSWEDAVEFCKRLSQKEGVEYRLPSEAEWEYACRAGSTTPFYTGGTISTEQANYDGNTTYGNGQKGENRQKTMSVGSFPANAFGLFDMHGNVWEWCGDWYDERYYANSASDDPQGPDAGAARVLRGGSWLNLPGYCRAAFRRGNVPSVRYDYYGFRVVCGL